jgi:hypothetical protein
MTLKEKSSFWRISLSFSAFIAIFYLLIYSGKIPAISKVVLSQKIHSGAQSFVVLNLPFAIPRILDIVFIFALTAIIIRLAQLAINEFNKNVKKEKSHRSKFAIAGGLLLGVIIGLIGGLAALIKNELLLGVFIIILIGFLACFISGILGFKFGLALGIAYSAMACLVFGLLEISSLSISLSIILGLIIMFISSVGAGLISLIKSLLKGLLTGNFL